MERFHFTFRQTTFRMAPHSTRNASIQCRALRDIIHQKRQLFTDAGDTAFFIEHDDIMRDRTK